MKSSEFCYWLQGYIEIGHDQMHQMGLNYEQTEIIKKHLSLVFKHELDQTHGSLEQQAELQAIHDAPIESKYGSIGPAGEIYRC